MLMSVNRHEIAFVFGQLLSLHSVPALLQVLRDDNQSDMVRHEAAEALGGIGAPDLARMGNKARCASSSARVL
jgi:HEAT repeat protein